MKKSVLRDIIKEELINILHESQSIAFDDLNFEIHAKEKFGEKTMNVIKDSVASLTITSQEDLNRHKDYLEDRYGRVEFEEWKPGSFSIVKGSSETYDDIKSSTTKHLQDYYNEPGFKGD